MGRLLLTTEILPVLAEQFRALSEPARLSLLMFLQQGELTVNELVNLTGLGQANVSKHLQRLHMKGFVHREKRGLFVYYRLPHREVVRLCAEMARCTLPRETP